PRRARPAQEDAEDPGVEVAGHADEVPNGRELRFAVFGDGRAEVVERAHGRDRELGVGRTPAQVLAALPRPVQRTAVRPPGLDLDAFEAEAPGALDQVLEGQRIAPVPVAHVRDAVQGGLDLPDRCRHGSLRRAALYNRPGTTEANSVTLEPTLA